MTRPRWHPDADAAEGPTNGAFHMTPPERTATVQPPPLAREPRVLDRLVEDVFRCGVVGERHIIELIYLVVVTRRFARPVNLALKGPSAGGKSFLLEQVLAYFPASAHYSLSGMSEHALVYDDEPLEHRMLVIYEAAGMAGDMQSYFIRSLLSEGRLRYVTVVKTKNGPAKKTIDRQGPTGLLTTTTAVHLHPENETRIVSATVTDTADQTKAIMLAQAGLTPDPDVDRWHELDAWIATTDPRVSIPFSKTLATAIPPVAVRLRRDFPTILSLVAAHALVHQLGRERDAGGQVIATFEDYGVVREIIVELIGEAVGRTVPDTVRETVDIVGALTLDGGETTVVAIAGRLGLDKSAASRRVRVAIDRGFLQNLEERRGRPSRIALGDPLPEAAPILPTAAELERLHGCSAPGGGYKESAPEDDWTVPETSVETDYPTSAWAAD